LKVETSSVPEAAESVLIACSLTARAAAERRRAWHKLLSCALVSRTRVVAGERVELEALPGVRDELERLVAAERTCCPFLTMSVEATDASLILTITAPALAAALVDELLTGPLGERES
jgi:MerR family transcriptional regulator, copper efflux regulator